MTVSRAFLRACCSASSTVLPQPWMFQDGVAALTFAAGALAWSLEETWALAVLRTQPATARQQTVKHSQRRQIVCMWATSLGCRHQAWARRSFRHLRGCGASHGL